MIKRTIRVTSLALLISITLVAAGCRTTTQEKAATGINAATAALEKAKAVAYAAQVGHNALQTLVDTGHVVEKDSSGMVAAIDGVKPGARQYWAFYVNGKLSDVGAEQYVAKAGDQIEWKLESF